MPALTSKPPSHPDQPDLPAELRPFAFGADLDDLELECASVERADMSGRSGAGVRIDQCRLSQVDFSDASLSQALLQDAVVLGGSWANLRTKEMRLRRVAFSGVRMTGADLSWASLDDVSFTDCRIDLGGFQNARMSRVVFERCRLDEMDLSGAQLASVTFSHCVLTRSIWTDATLVRCELRDSDIAGARNPERLRGVRMTWPDVLASAAVFATALGIEIVDEPG